MADESVVLGIKVDSTDLKRAGIELKQLRTDSAAAEKATKELGTGYKNLKASLDPVFAAQQNLDRSLKIIDKEMQSGKKTGEDYAVVLAKVHQRYNDLVAEANGSAEAVRKNAAEASKAAQQFTSLKSSLDPVYAANIRLKESTDSLNLALKHKVITDEEYQQTLAQVNSRHNETISSINNVKKATEQAESDVDKLSNSYKRLITALDPLRAVTEQTKEGVKTLNAAFKAGVIDQRQFDDAMSKLTQRHRDLKARIAGTTNAENENAKATERAKQEYIELKRTLDPLFAVTNQYERSVKTLDKALNSGSITLEQHKTALEQVKTRYALLTDQVNGVGKSFRKLRGAAGNIGFQLQDIAVQAQAGTDAFIIFSQQGSQLASAFGPGGAVLGAVIAVAGAIGGVLFKSLMDASEELEEFNDRVDALIQSLDRVQLRKINSDIEQQEKLIKSLRGEIEGYLFVALRDKEVADLVDELTVKLGDQEAALEANIKKRKELLGIKDPVKDSLSSLASYLDSLQLQVDLLGKSKAEIAAYRAELMGAAIPERERAARLAQSIADYEKAQKDKEEADKRAKAASDAAYKSLIGNIKEAIKAEEEQAKKFQSLLKEIDPVRAKIEQLTEKSLILKQLFDKGLIDEATFKKWQKIFSDGIIDLATDSGDDFFDHFLKGVDGIGDALQSAIMSGDFAGVGNAVGGILANATSSAFEATFSESLGGLGAGLLGGIAGGLVGGAITSAFDSISSSMDVEDPTEARQAAQGTGTILGAIDKKSQSIARSNDLIANAAGDLVNINSGMLDKLSELSGAISNVTASVIASRTGIDAPNVQNQAGDAFTDLASGIINAATLGLGSLLPDNLVKTAGSLLADTAVSGLLNGATLGLGSLLTSGSRSRQIDEGIRIVGGKIQDVIDNTVVEGFATFEVRKNYFDDYDVKERFVSLGDDVSDQFSDIFSGIIGTVASGVGALGIDSGAVAQALEDFTIETQKISLEGLDAAAKEAEIQAVFSKIFDEVAQEVVDDTLPFLSELADGGEGLGETLTRVTTQFLSVEEAAASLGFIFAGTTEELVRASDSLITRVGGLQAFNSLTASFEKNFLTVEQQLENQGRRLNDVLASIGEELPETRDGFADLVTGLQDVARADEETLATLLQLTPAAAEYYSLYEQHLKDTADSIEDVVDIVAKLEQAVADASGASDTALDRLRQSVEAERDEIANAYDEAVKLRETGLKDEVLAIKEAGKERAKEIKRLSADNIDDIRAREKARLKLIKDEEDERLKANKLALDAAKDGLRAIVDELKGITSALEKLNLAAISSEQRRSNALAVLRRASVTGDLTGTGEAAGVAAGFTQGDFSSGVDFRRQVGLTRSVLTQLEDAGEQQKSDAEIAIERLEQQTQAIKDNADRAIEVAKDNADRAIETAKENADRAIEANDRNTAASVEAAELRAETELAKMQEVYEDEMERLDFIVQNATDQLNALRGIDASVLSVRDAVAAFGSALAAERAARQQLEAEIAKQNEPEPEPTVATDQSPLSDWSLLTPDPSTPITASWFDLNTVPQFADGGMHSGGLRIVGENGPELELTGPSRIINNNDLMGALSDGSVADQIKQLRSEMNRVLMSIARSSGKAAKRLDRWEGDGLPNFREPQEVV